jgi:hypothetical protein
MWISGSSPCGDRATRSPGASNPVHRLGKDGAYRLLLYPDRWIGAFKGVDKTTDDHAGQRCH